MAREVEKWRVAKWRSEVVTVSERAAFDEIAYR
jgi:hypothetical protein